MTKANIKYLNHTIKRKRNRWSNGGNHIVAVLEPKIVKTKNVSKGENLSKVAKDEIFDVLPSHF